jgi:alpha-L-fucosidase
MKNRAFLIGACGVALCAAVLSVPLAALCGVKPVDLSHVPQINESKEQRYNRMQWFRDAKLGMMICWGPSSLGECEIGWSRKAARPWDIGKPNNDRQRTEDPVYDNYYKEFNPTNFNADAWAQMAKAYGFEYVVVLTKHHDGFSMFDSKVTDYDIMATPYKRDIIKQFADAFHKQGIRFGLYYSTRDWYHPDYLQGDNAKYDQWYRTQIEELLSNYGSVSVLWFDSVGGNDWGKWKFDELFSMMYRLQPRLLVNNRVKFIGPKTPEDRGPASPEIKTMTQGDFGTPEGVIGAFTIDKDWESCLRVGRGWSYRGEEGHRKPADVIRMLVSAVTGGGNLLLSFGPRPDGSIVGFETEVAQALGNWLKKNGEAIYGTRGGPYRNGIWGGSCHKGDKLYLHFYQWRKDGWTFDPLPCVVKSARTLAGAKVQFEQTAKALSLRFDKAEFAAPATVVELTLDQPVKDGLVVGGVHGEDLSEHGKILSENATLELSSQSRHDKGEHERLFKGQRAKYGDAFQTEPEKNPWAKIDLGAVKNVKAVVIENKPTERRSEGLILSVSTDGQKWTEIWKAEQWDLSWTVPITTLDAGAEVPGRKARYFKVETKGDSARPLILQRFTVYGEE